MVIDGITYDHRMSNFMEAKNHAMKLLGMLKGCIKINGESADIDIGSVLANIGSPEMQSIEQFVIRWVTVTDEAGSPVQLNKVDVFNTHFNTHRSHYVALIIDGLKFHFADFLPAGVASRVSMPGSVMLKTQ